MSLRLKVTIDRGALLGLAKQVEVLFALLRTLSAGVDAQALSTLCSMISRVQELSLDVVNASHSLDVFGALSSLANIRILEFSSAYTVQGNELERLESLPRLKVLCIWAPGPHLSSEDEFARVLSRLRRLRTLKLPMTVGLSYRSYVHVAKRCPRLTCLDLNVDCDATHFRGPGGRPLFLSLKSLLIRSSFKRASKLGT